MIFNPELQQLAKLVQQLRVVQKANGSGYKTTAGGTQAKKLETEVDAAIAKILKPPFHHHGVS